MTAGQRWRENQQTQFIGKKLVCNEPIQILPPNIITKLLPGCHKTPLIHGSYGPRDK